MILFKYHGIVTVPVCSSLYQHLLVNFMTKLSEGGGVYLQMRLTNSVFEGACKEGWLGMGHPRGDNELSVWLRTR